MEKWDARLFQMHNSSDTFEHHRNVVELESHRQLHRRIHELIQLCNSSMVTTSEMQQHLQYTVALFGPRFTLYLVRALQHTTQTERQSIVWLLTLLNDHRAIHMLQQISLNKSLSRSVRLSASLALAGMSATREITNHPKQERLYAIS